MTAYGKIWYEHATGGYRYFTFKFQFPTISSVIALWTYEFVKWRH
jgi:hypothetical protein